ncbi:MAG TPA: methyltransferase domain-containing protein [Bryobacteraceae bacterium]|nr:methyltransferase domain-containing protein [Bryobacteraceae bacterium]
MKKWALLLRYIFSDWRLARAYRAGNLNSRGGSTHSRFTLDQSLAYIDRVFTEYFEFGGLLPREIRDWQVLEAGPGDNFGVALRFLTAGAGKVTCLDKFYAERDEIHQAKIYRALRERLSGEEAVEFDRIVRWENELARFDPARLEYIYGLGLEESEGRLRAGSFDLVISRAVLTEIPDAEKSFQVMDRLLKPGGLMLHKIDLSDYDMLSGLGYSPLEFLTVPESIWKAMASHAGRPNRRRVNFYRDILDRLGYDSQLHIVQLAGKRESAGPGRLRLETIPPALREELRQIRPRLAAPFRSLTDEDILISDLFMTARKPANRSV